MAGTCKKVCAGKKTSIMYEQCRDDEGKIVSMRKLGSCNGGNEGASSQDVKRVEV